MAFSSSERPPAEAPDRKELNSAHSLGELGSGFIPRALRKERRPGDAFILAQGPTLSPGLLTYGTVGA